MPRRRLGAATAALGWALAFACAPSLSDPNASGSDPNERAGDAAPSDATDPDHWGVSDGPSSDDHAVDDGGNPSDSSTVKDAAPIPPTIHVQGAPFAFVLLTREGGTQLSSAALDYAFEVDTTEVTVGQFKQWVQAGSPFPDCGGQSQCSLDPGGPYETSMQWSTALGASAAARAQPWSSPDAGCVDFAISTNAQTYFVADDAPMNCINWYHAVAYCAWRGKRLLTETEMHFLTTGHGDGRKYPWGNDDPSDCSHAIWATSSFCGFPVPVGSAREGASKDGVLDLAGSLNEWLWDGLGDYPADAGTNYAGPAWSGDPGMRSCRGGGYWANAKQLQNSEREYGADYYVSFQEAHRMWSGVGFRCAKTAH